MATRIKYTEEFKEHVLKEIKNGADIEDVSQRYEVPVVIIKEWQKRKEFEEYLNATIVNPVEVHTSRWTSVKGELNSKLEWMKNNKLLGGLLAGCFGVAFLSIVFYGNAEFNPTVDQNTDLALKIDSLIIQGSKIENSLTQQNEISTSISNAVTNISNTVTNIHETNNYKFTFRRPVKYVQKKSCCCLGMKCDKEYKCKNDTIK